MHIFKKQKQNIIFDQITIIGLTIFLNKILINIYHYIINISCIYIYNCLIYLIVTEIREGVGNRSLSTIPIVYILLIFVIILYLFHIYNI